MPDIFISYAREDRARIQPLAEWLEHHGWTVFWDRKIPTGKNWHTMISEALDGARRVIVAWSKDSLESDFVRDEAASALERRILVPILIDHVTPPLGFRQIQAADFTEWHGEEDAPALQQLLQDLGPPSGRSGSSLPAAALAAPKVPTVRTRRRGFLAITVAAGAASLLAGVVVMIIGTRGQGNHPPPVPDLAHSSERSTEFRPVDTTGVERKPTAGGGGPTAPGDPLLVERQQLLRTLKAYYRGVNAGSFDADAYFAPRVSLYIGMQNTSPVALDRYFKVEHPCLYGEYRVDLQEDTLVRERPLTWKYREIARFVELTGKKRRRTMSADVRVTIDDDGKIVRFEQAYVSG